MTKFEHIRKVLLDVTQDELAKVLGKTQANVSNYEKKGQPFPPDAAKRLIEFGKTKGVVLSYDDIYPTELELEHKPG